VKHRLTPLFLLAALSACTQSGITESGGVYATRSSCPVAGVPTGTGDITLFSQAGTTDASALDVTAAITNVRASCDDTGANVISVISFDVVATRRTAGPARQVLLPYFSTVVRGGSDIVAKRTQAVALNFAAGGLRAQASGQATVSVSRAAATLPANVRQILSQDRKPGDEAAAVDPLSDPAIRRAVAQATFEHLVGFQLTDDQLRYNVTR
jgi:hypothetical protein